MATRLKQLEDLARVFHSLGNPIRLRLVELLSGGEKNVGALCKKLKIPQASTSHHLRLLHIGGVVTKRREGKQIFYSIADLTKHRLGKKSETAKARTNAAKFGPAELSLPKK